MLLKKMCIVVGSTDLQMSDWLSWLLMLKSSLLILIFYYAMTKSHSLLLLSNLSHIIKLFSGLKSLMFSWWIKSICQTFSCNIPVLKPSLCDIVVDAFLCLMFSGHVHLQPSTISMYFYFLILVYEGNQ